MTQGTPEQFRRLVSEARREHAIALLRWLDPAVAAEAFMSLPCEEQEGLFRRLPIDLAATLVENLPYATVLMSVIVVTVNRLVWRPLYSLAATRFALEN